MNEKENNRISVLIVDDMHENLELIIDFLEKFDIEIMVAMSGKAAFQRLGNSKPDIIILDVILPEMDGFEICRRLKKMDEYKDIPVIFMSGLTEDVDKANGYKAGGVDYIIKPLQLEDVLTRIRIHIKISKLQRELKELNLAREKLSNDESC